MAPFSLPASSALPSPEWYEIYFAAVSENDEQRAQVQLDRVAKLMEERIVQLRSAAANQTQELEDLGCALTYVRLLLIASSPIVSSPSIDGQYRPGTLTGTSNACRTQ